jgi:hypothetical protein
MPGERSLSSLLPVTSPPQPWPQPFRVEHTNLLLLGVFLDHLRGCDPKILERVTALVLGILENP